MSKPKRCLKLVIGVDLVANYWLHMARSGADGDCRRGAAGWGGGSVGYCPNTPALPARMRFGLWREVAYLDVHAAQFGTRPVPSCLTRATVRQVSGTWLFNPRACHAFAENRTTREAAPGN